MALREVGHFLTQRILELMTATGSSDFPKSVDLLRGDSLLDHTPVVSSPSSAQGWGEPQAVGWIPAGGERAGCPCFQEERLVLWPQGCAGPWGGRKVGGPACGAESLVVGRR